MKVWKIIENIVRMATSLVDENLSFPLKNLGKRGIKSSINRIRDMFSEIIDGSWEEDNLRLGEGKREKFAFETN